MTRAEVLRRVGGVWEELLQLGDLACAWGQGSVISGFVEAGDIDLVLVWRDSVPDREDLLRRFHDPDQGELSYVHREPWYLDRLFFAGEELNLAHHPLSRVDAWARRPSTDARQLAWDVNGMGFLSGLVRGVPIEGADLLGEWVDQARSLPALFVSEAREKLGSRAEVAAHELTKASERHDWLVYFHVLADVARDAMINAFASAGAWYPSDKWLVKCAIAAGVDHRVISAFEQVWAERPGPDQLERVEALVEASLASG